MAKKSNKRYQLMIPHVENERSKYELECEKQEKSIMEKNLDFISDSPERNYFKVNKIEIIGKNCNIPKYTLIVL